MNKNAEILELVKSGEKVAPEAGPRPEGVTAYDPCSHVSNAQRIAHHFGDRLMYVPGLGWHTWGPPWKLDELGARKIAAELGRIIAQETIALNARMAAAKSTDERDARQKHIDQRVKWAKASESGYCLEQSMRLAEPLLVVKAETLDADPLLLGCTNGVLNLDSGEFREHRQHDRITHVMGCHYDPKAQCHEWEKFLGSTFDGDEELIGWLQRFVGYCLSGKRGEHLLPIAWGSGSNGKGTMLESLLAMFGEYGSMGPPGLLMEQYGTQHPT